MSEMLNKEFSRKTFVKGGGALIVGFSVAGAGFAGRTQAADSPFASNGPPALNQVDSFLMIHADNTASVMSGHTEFGQGSDVGIVLITAEELDMAVSQVKFLNPDTNLTPSTGGTTASNTISTKGRSVRAAAAYAKQALLGMAATQLGVPVASLTVANGVVSGGGRSVSYGALIGDKSFNVTMPNATLSTGQAPAKTPNQYKLVGSRVPRFDVPAKVTGKYTYVHSIRVPGMLHGRLVRPRGQAAYPSGAPVVSVDESSIRHVLGARVIRKGDFVAVVAEREYDAIRAAAQLKVKWADPPAMAGSGNFWKQMRDFDSKGQVAARIQVNTGDVDAAFSAAPVKVAGRTYKVGYQGHLGIGPICAVADATPKGAVVFSNSQNVYSTRQHVANATGLPLNTVRIRYIEGASVYGLAPYDDGAAAAALTSLLAGAPVRLQFMRWDDHGWDNHGNPLLADIRGAVDANGRIVAYEYTGFAQPGTGLSQTTLQLSGASTPPTPGLGSAEVGNTVVVYDVPNRRIIGKSLPLFNNYLKLGFLRGVANAQAAYASEQFIDELAYAAKVDPVEFRRRNLNPANADRLRSALDTAANLSNWRPKVAASELESGNVVTGRGIALTTIFPSGSNPDVPSQGAVVVDIEVNKQTGKIIVIEAWAALNAGLTVSPGTMENQIVGAVIHGVGRSLHEEMLVDTKRVTSLDWVTYPILRFKEAPRVHPAIVQRTDLQPTGAGEPAMVPVAPAVANAFFDATGVRIRQMPMTPARVRGVLKAAGIN
jgi:CO/xanthine dehydrogenase Mo-binding subunit